MPRRSTGASWRGIVVSNGRGDRSRGCAMHGRLVWLGVLLVLGGALPVVGCGAPPDCASGSATGPSSVKLVSCADSSATLRVLGHVDNVNDCVNVPGTAVAYYDSEQTRDSLCLGPKDADPARGMNSAQVGDCLTDFQGSDVSKLDCGDAAAAYRVLSRKATGSAGGEDLLTNCFDTPGSTAHYTWTLHSTRPGIPLESGLSFCLIGKGLDPARSTDHARVGACLAPTAVDPGNYQQVDCTDPTAVHRVLERFDGSPNDGLCDSVPGATEAVSTEPGDFSGYTLCVSPIN